MGNVTWAVEDLLALLAGIGDASPDSMFAKDLEGRYLWMNAASAANIGLAASEIIGRFDREFISPANYELLSQVDREVMETRVPMVVEQSMTVDGVERSFLFSKRPLWQNGRVIGLVGTAHETTQQRKAEETMLRQNQLYETVLAAESEIARVNGDYHTLLETVLKSITAITRPRTATAGTNNRERRGVRECCIGGILCVEAGRTEGLPPDLRTLTGRGGATQWSEVRSGNPSTPGVASVGRRPADGGVRR